MTCGLYKLQNSLTVKKNATTAVLRHQSTQLPLQFKIKLTVSFQLLEWVPNRVSGA